MWSPDGRKNPLEEFEGAIQRNVVALEHKQAKQQEHNTRWNQGHYSGATNDRTKTS